MLYSIQGRKENYCREEAAFSVPGRKKSELERKLYQGERREN